MSSEASSNLFTVNSPTHFQELLSADLSRVSVLNFWASFAEPCTTMNAEVEKLSKDTSSILFLNIEAEEQADIVESFDVTSVPTVLLLQVSLVLPTELCLAPQCLAHTPPYPRFFLLPALTISALF